MSYLLGPCRPGHRLEFSRLGVVPAGALCPRTASQGLSHTGELTPPPYSDLDSYAWKPLTHSHFFRRTPLFILPCRTRATYLYTLFVQNRASIKVTRSEVLDFPSSKPALKPEVRRRLDDIASQTLAHIAVVNSPFSLSTRTPPDGISSSAGWSGLETERVCELVITGPGDSVDIARVRLLVMLDELVRCVLSFEHMLPLLPHIRLFRSLTIPASCAQCRMACMQKCAISTKSFRLSSQAENDICCSRYKRRLRRTFTTPPHCTALSVLTWPTCLRYLQHLVAPHDRTKTLSGSPESSLAFRGRGTCCSKLH